MHDTLIVLWLIIIILLLIFNQSKNVSEAKLTRGGVGRGPNRFFVYVIL